MLSWSLAFLLLSGGLVADGRGGTPRRADVRIEGDKIVAVGKLKPNPGEQVIDVTGMVVAPGFIDMHSHADVVRLPGASAAVRQGITTVLVGMDGGSRFPLSDYFARLEKDKPALNLASMSGHATLRRQAMGSDLFRAATADEVARMKDLLDKEMQAGAYGLSTGLEYEAGHQATTDELVQLSKVAARYGGFYISHVRDEASLAFDSFREIATIGKDAQIPVQISHIKLGGKSVWHKTREMAAIFDDARKRHISLTADLYPYTFWNSTIRVIITDRDFYNREKVGKAIEENGGASGIRLIRYSPDASWQGKTLAEISQLTGMAVEDVYMKVVRETDNGRGSETILGTSMTEEDIRWFMRRPEVMFSTDGALEGGHPRGAGTYPRILGRYVREQKVISLGKAIHKATAQPAERLGLRDRGQLRPGYFADIVVFDPAKIIDRATVENPGAPPEGIPYVFVNGQAVVEKSVTTELRPGRVLRRAPPLVQQSLQPTTLEPIVYTVRVPAPDTHLAEIEAVVPTGRKLQIELMMPVWSPGFYRVEDYAGKVQDFAARTPAGEALAVEKTARNKWTIQTAGAPKVILSYKVFCNQRSVTTNYVGNDMGVFNGAPTFVTLAEKAQRPHEVHLELPAAWKRAMTGLEDAPDRLPNHFRARDFETLVDSPILAGDLQVTEFEVDSKKHYVVAAGNTGQWNGQRATADLRKMVEEVRKFIGALPYDKYDFLLVFRQGGGGLEHKNSTLANSGGNLETPEGYRRWLGFIGHEYFHAFNVKRLRPIELGPFDWENAPHTGSLWISEGVTTYYADLLLARAGLYTQQDLLSSLSSQIASLQSAPGRLLQSVEQSSLDVWNNSNSGVGVNASTVSYYVKGAVLGFLLDARIRHATNGAKSFDDLFRLAYQRYGGERGFKAEEFRAAAEEVAGVDLKDWFRKSISSVEELDYSEALDWFGLRFTAGEGRIGAWKLAVRADATEAQRESLRNWLGALN